ncbi:MAG TPA: hypothetical protein VFN25_08160 [Dokdonella sp.]|uniref:dioxygenase family protein n=1 Tax=Dokdonella sp. TaxID=2291710 RepID=UPI002D7E34D2|nr:hypothetical protein [Dokdonella sp.]HET9032864.1 hypothetical protein [Dokdonella sp.]
MMIRILCLALLCLVISPPSPAALPRWDAVPAIDVMHLQGAYAGRVICPMCQHGYDAGILVFMPSTVSPALASLTARTLRRAAAKIRDDRFRTFVVVTGSPPSGALLDAVRSTDREWYVAHLDSAALAGASRDFAIDLQKNAHALVFSQRRRLWAFDPLDEPRRWEIPLQDHARYAMQFLQSNYPQASASGDPDSSRGRLWLAPGRLSSTLSLAQTSKRQPLKACFADAADDEMAHGLLLAVHARDRSASRRVHWASSDRNGCISLSGIDQLGSLRIEVFEPLHAAWTASIDLADAKDTDHVDVRPQQIAADAVTGNEPVSVACEGCEAVFIGLPSVLSSSARIAPANEPGEPLLVSGIVRNKAGLPQTGVVVYAYQTDARGHYPRDPRLTGAAANHGRLRAWARTDNAGRYAFQTIRPGAYPGRTSPQHIHMHVIEPGRCTYYVGDLMFTDDPRLTDEIRKRNIAAFGGSGIGQAHGDAHSGWRASRDIVLGLNLPAYETCQSQGR